MTALDVYHNIHRGHSCMSCLSGEILGGKNEKHERLDIYAFDFRFLQTIDQN